MSKLLKISAWLWRHSIKKHDGIAKSVTTMAFSCCYAPACYATGAVSEWCRWPTGKHLASHTHLLLMYRYHPGKGPSPTDDSLVGQRFWTFWWRIFPAVIAAVQFLPLKVRWLDEASSFMANVHLHGMYDKVQSMEF